MRKDHGFWDDHEMEGLVHRFEEQLNTGNSFFFDVDDFALIIDYYLEATNVKLAEVSLNHAIDLHPQAVIFKVKQAQLLAITNHAQRALALLNSIESLEPYNADIIRTKANIFSHLEQYDAAIEEYKKLTIEDDAEDIYSNIAFEYENKEQFSRAIHYLKLVLEINPYNENALYEIAFCYESQGNIKESIQYFNAYVQENPLSSIGWFNLGVAYAAVDQNEHAIEAFDFAIALEPDYPSAYFNKASVLCNQEKYELAIEEYKSTLKLEAPEAFTLHYIGECYEKMGALEKAAEHYHKAVDINENISDAWAGLASVFYQQGEYIKAIPFIDKAIHSDTKNPDYLMAKGDIARQAEQYEMAMDAYSKALDLDLEDIDCWLDLAEVTALNSEHLADGITVLREALAFFPDHATILYRLSFYLFTNEQTKEGFQVLQEALHINFSQYKEFLELDDSLPENPLIIDLIEQVKHIKQNS
ncbi:MAG: tetratricopeptide repeat protein [Bacteroidales bacterium]